MSHVPNGREVDQVIAAVSKEVKTALKQLNQQAGMFLAKGHYGKAEELVSKGRSINNFLNKVKALRADWREIRKAAPSKSKDKGDTTPLWGYYQPILRILHSLGGRAIRNDLEREFETSHLSQLKSGDMAPMARGIPRWQKMIAKAKKAMIQEGFIEDTKNIYWQLTDHGKQIAESGSANK